MKAWFAIVLLALPLGAAGDDVPAPRSEGPPATTGETPAAAEPGKEAPPAAEPAPAKEAPAGAEPAPATEPSTAKEAPAATEPAPAAEPAAPKPVMPPPAGSQVKPDDNLCFMCHTNKDQWDEKDPKSWRLFIPEDKLREDVHFLKGVNCHDCHGGNYNDDKINVAHAQEDGFRSAPAEIKKFCAVCHKENADGVLKSVHGKAGERNEQDRKTAPLACDKCHGPVSHHTFPVRNPQSPVFIDHQVQMCGGCHVHAEHLKTYNESVHGQGLNKMGLLVTAACADCHGAHGIYFAHDQRSTLYRTHVAKTCGKCHRFIEERLEKSVHGGAAGAGGMADRVAPGGKSKEKPTCTSCHEGHDIFNPEGAAFRLQLPNRCGNCHAGLSKEYSVSIHGELTALGYAPGAKCSDCHGSHDILPLADPASHLAPANRAQTCERCHPNATANFLEFDPHADHTVSGREPVLHWIYLVLMTLLVSTFAAFGLHSVLWFVRSLIDVLKEGRPGGLRPGGLAYERFTPAHRVSHTFLLISFLGLALTGLPLKYSAYGWARHLAQALGGFGSTATWHRIFGLVTIGFLVLYVVRMARRYREGRQDGRSRKGIVFGPDSLVPNWRDLGDLFRMIRWFIGLGPKPTFERWSYWEKFDFWGACTDTIIIGTTGLILWFPNLFCSFLPGISLNIAKVIHSTQALLATGFVFAVHFFNTHLRPEKFPADMSVLTGLVSEPQMEEERPEFLERMRAEGKLDTIQVRIPSRNRLWAVKLGGFVALAVGLALLAGMVVAGVGQ